MTFRLVLILIVSSLLMSLSTFADAPTSQPAQDIETSIQRGVEFLVKNQNADGSWGTGTKTNGFEVYSMVPGSMDAYKSGASALCVIALREAGEKPAHDKGLEYLIGAPQPKRDDGELMYNTWGHIYCLQAFSEEILAHNKDPRLKPAAERALKSLVRYATHVGGWNYYDFDAHTESASMGPTSFGTAAGLVALYEARQAGLDVPQRLIDRSLHRIEECRLPNGFYLYGSDYKYIPRIPANMERGAVGRTQPCNYCLWLWKSPKVNQPAIREGLEAFFRDHAFLDMGRKHPVPHQKWYQTSGYYYYYDHYYAARLLESLPPSDRSGYATRIAAHVLPHQEPDDGSWWDFPMWDFHKPYGTAFAVMTLLRCK